MTPVSETLIRTPDVINRRTPSDMLAIGQLGGAALGDFSINA